MDEAQRDAEEFIVVLSCPSLIALKMTLIFFYLFAYFVSLIKLVLLHNKPLTGRQSGR